MSITGNKLEKETRGKPRFEIFEWTDKICECEYPIENNWTCETIIWIVVFIHDIKVQRYNEISC